MIYIKRILNRSRPLTIEAAELERLRAIERMTAKMVEQLEDGKVDYDLLRHLKRFIRG